MNKPIGSEFDKLQCPYNPIHIIDRGRFIVHLTRCRPKEKDEKYVVCPFNVSHRMKSKEFNAHLPDCRELKYLFNFKYTIQPATVLAPTPVTAMPVVETAENWDDESDVPAYDPKTYAENAAVLRLCQNAPPLERKIFRKAEHLRLKKLGDD